MHVQRSGLSWILVGVVVIALLAAAHLLALAAAPAERTMGGLQRIMYVHVPVAWCGLLGMLFTAGCGLLYLLQGRLSWDRRGQAAAEVGWICTGLTLVTGMLWARGAWGVWWTWDPRLTASAVLWLLYAGYFCVRRSVADRIRQGRLAAVVALVAALDVPLVTMATRWFRGIHPVAPELPAAMAWTLAASALATASAAAVLVLLRCRQLQLSDRLVQQELDVLEHLERVGCRQRQPQVFAGTN